MLNTFPSIRRDCLLSIYGLISSSASSLSIELITRLLSIPTHAKMLISWNIIIVAINNALQLRVTKNTYIDYGIICIATCHMIWAFITVFESFLRRES